MTSGLLADYASVTADGKLNLMGVFSRVVARAVPITHSLFLIAHFSARVTEGSGHSLQIALVDADGQEVIPRTGLLPLMFSMNGPGHPLTAQIIVELINLQLPAFGDYEFHLHVDATYTASIPLYVEQAGGLT